MKKLLTFFVLIVFAVCGGKAVAQSCCAKPGDMQLMALNADFKASHLPPAPFRYTSQKGSMIQFKTQDGKTGNAYYVPSDEPTNKVLIIFHEWWGLNDYIKREAENWQQLLGNVDVYAVDLYDGQVATTPDMASKLMSGLDPKRADYIIDGMLSKAGRDKQIATLGWCMGGAWSFRASVLAGKEAAGCVMYYGFPEKDDKKIKPLMTDVVYIWGSQDNFIKKPFVDEFGNKIKAGGHKFSFYSFDAPHAFANPSNPKYNALFATQAQDIALKFLKEKLGLD